MSRIRCYTDEHVSKAVIRGLRERGIDVLSVPEANMLGASDEEHLAFALAESRVIFTQDADFLRLAAAGMNTRESRTPDKEHLRGILFKD